MRALVAAGRPAEALAAYETTRSYLADTLGSDPSAALQEQHLAVLRLQDAGPSTRRTNLRAPVTSFVGRDDDAAQGRASCSAAGGWSPSSAPAAPARPGSPPRSRRPGSPARPTGCGSSSWPRSATPTTSPSPCSTGSASATCRRSTSPAERPPRETRDRVLQTLADAESLVVIDNCEHVVDAVAGLVADILGRCPGVRVIATSREPLGIDGETLFALTPLAAARRRRRHGRGRRGSPPSRLLLDRAARRWADLTLDESTVADVVEVVRRLDGLPLAIELAAARLRVLSIAEVAARLADRFRLLTGGRRTAMPRHRTLRAVVEWSWELLTPLEREVAERFSVFGSGATRRRGRGRVPERRRRRLEDVLHALVDKSLLVAAPGRRRRALPHARDAARVRHRAARRAGRARADPAGPRPLLRRAGPGRPTATCAPSEQVVWLRRLDAERDNLLTALAYLGEHDRPADAARHDGRDGLGLDAAGERQGLGPLAAVRPRRAWRGRAADGRRWPRRCT